MYYFFNNLINHKPSQKPKGQYKNDILVLANKLHPHSVPSGTFVFLANGPQDNNTPSPSEYTHFLQISILCVLSLGVTAFVVVGKPT